MNLRKLAIALFVFAAVAGSGQHSTHAAPAQAVELHRDPIVDSQWVFDPEKITTDLARIAGAFGISF